LPIVHVAYRPGSSLRLRWLEEQPVPARPARLQPNSSPASGKVLAHFSFRYHASMMSRCLAAA